MQTPLFIGGQRPFQLRKKILFMCWCIDTLSFSQCQLSTALSHTLLIGSKTELCQNLNGWPKEFRYYSSCHLFKYIYIFSFFCIMVLLPITQNPKCFLMSAVLDGGGRLEAVPMLHDLKQHCPCRTQCPATVSMASDYDDKEEWLCLCTLLNATSG